MKCLLAFSLVFYSFTAFSQHVSTFDVILDTREDEITAKEITRLQGRVKVGFTIDIYGGVELVGLATTGPSFNNDWSTLNTNNGSTDEVNLAFRNLYLRKVMGNTTIEAGALNPEQTVGGGGLGSSGWVDGVRIKVNTRVGDFKVVAGSLGDFKTPNAFNRKFEGNFVEIEMDHKIFENLLTQTAYENYNGDSFVRESIRLDLKLFGTKLFKLFADSLYDIERDAFNLEVGGEFDVLKTIMNKHDHRLDLKLYYSDVNENIPGRDSTLTAFYTYGPRTTIQLGGKIDKKGNINWYTRAVLGAKGQNRYDVGIQVKRGAKKS